jgi:hypothetical protein
MAVVVRLFAVLPFPMFAPLVAALWGIPGPLPPLSWCWNCPVLALFSPLVAALWGVPGPLPLLGTGICLAFFSAASMRSALWRT